MTLANLTPLGSTDPGELGAFRAYDFFCHLFMDALHPFHCPFVVINVVVVSNVACFVAFVSLGDFFS